MAKNVTCGCNSSCSHCGGKHTMAEVGKECSCCGNKIKKVETTNEGLGDMAHMAERDHEVQMARAELYKLAKYAIKLHDMLKGVSEAEGIEGWMQSKITKAADYIGSVYHTLDYDMATESKKTYKSTMTEKDAVDYKSQLKERMVQKKSDLTELGPDTLYKYWNKAYDDVSDPRGKDPEKLKKRRAFMKKAAADHNKKKGWERPQGVKKSAGDASKSAAALAKHLAKKDMRANEDLASDLRREKEKQARNKARTATANTEIDRDKATDKLHKMSLNRSMDRAKHYDARMKLSGLRKSKSQ